MNKVDESKLKRINGIVVIIAIILITIVTILLLNNIKKITICGIIISYSIVIIIGLLTIIRTYYNEKKNNLEITKELELLYKPSIKINKTRNKDNLINEINIITNNNKYRDNNENYGHYYLEIINNGKVEILNLKIKNIKVETINKELKPIGYLKKESIINSLSINDKLVIAIGTPENIYNNDISTIYNVSFVIEYKGILSNKITKNKISFTITNNNKNRNDIYDYKIEEFV